MNILLVSVGYSIFDANMTNHYLSIRDQIPTFHAGDVIAGDTSWIEAAYLEHLDRYFS